MNTRAILAALCAGLCTICAMAAGGIHTWCESATLHVAADSRVAGKGLVLLWNLKAGGDETVPADYQNTSIVAASVPAAGATYAIDLSALGIANGVACRVATATIYEKLDKLQMSNNNTWLDTGVRDSDVYGVEFGFQPISSGNGTSHWCYCIGTSESGFTVGENGSAITTCVSCYRGTKFTAGAARPVVSDSAINHYAYTNTVATLDGNVFKTGLAAGMPVGETGMNMYLGTACIVRTEGYSGGTRYLRGWWAYVRFYDAGGGLLLDYTPVRRVSDGAAGFWDGASNEFKTSSGTTAFTAGAALGGYITANLEIAAAATPDRALAATIENGAVAISAGAGLEGEQILVAWGPEDMGGNLEDWPNFAVALESVSSASPAAIRLGRFGVKPGDKFRVFAANRYIALDALETTGSGQYVETTIADSDVYSASFGFKNTATPGKNKYMNAIGTGRMSTESEIGDSGWTLGVVGREVDGQIVCKMQWVCHDKSNTQGPVYADAVQNFVFANGVFTVDGQTVATGLNTSPVGSIGDYASRPMRIGTWNSPDHRFQTGQWQYVQFRDASGNLILDFIPVRLAAADGTPGAAGFYDRATKTFHASSQNAFPVNGVNTPQAGATAVYAVNSVSPVQNAVISGLVIIIH